MGSLPLKMLRRSARSVREPERRAIVVCDCQAETFRHEHQAGDGRRRVEAAQLAFLGSRVGSLAGRPRDRTVRPKRHLIDPALLLVGCGLMMPAVSGGLNDLAVIAARDDALPVRGACKDGTGMDTDPFFTALIRKQQCLLTEDEDRRRAKKMNADDRRAPIERPYTIGD